MNPYALQNKLRKVQNQVNAAVLEIGRLMSEPERLAVQCSPDISVPRATWEAIQQQLRILDGAASA